MPKPHHRASAHPLSGVITRRSGVPLFEQVLPSQPGSNYILNLAHIASDPTVFAVCVAAVLVSGISKAGFGGGVGGLSVPIMSLVITPVDAAAIMLPILVLMDIAGLWYYRARIDRANMRIIVPAGLVGSLLGWWFFNSMNEHWIRILIGLISVSFALYNAARRKPVLAHPSPVKGWFWAGTSGFTSFVAHSGGAPLAVYLLGQRMEKAVFVGTNMVFFCIMNAIKIVPYAFLGLLDTRNLSASSALAPAALAGVALGIWLIRRLSPVGFYRLVTLLMFISGAKLLHDGIGGLLHG